MKLIIVKAVMAAILLTPLSTFAQAPKTGQDLFQICSDFIHADSIRVKATTPEERSVNGMLCMTYLSEIRDKVELLNREAQLEGREPSLFCIPQGIQMGEVAKAMGYSLQGLDRNNRKALDGDAYSVASNMLGVLFPCGSK